VSYHGEDQETAANLGGDDALHLQPGVRLGRYEILDLLGSGGMGRVYRARDVTLDREVAIKALARTFHEDSASLLRFEREAKVLAALDHPGIATIYGLEWVDAAPYLILELIEGETLGDRLSRGALPAPQAMATATQIAQALEEAHRLGVVHRDLKPSNVMLGPDGRVTVLDFGLAKAIPVSLEKHDESASSSQLTTASGTVLGTAPYMSPEQVRGDDVDTRSDVWAFGCLLYEMLSGERAFRGRNVADISAAVLRDEVNWDRLPSGTPSAVRHLLRRCLRRERTQRLQAIGDARVELEEAARGEGEAPPVTGRPRGRWAPWVVSTLCAAVAAASLLRARPATRVPDVRLSLELPASVSLLNEFPAPFAISADGSRIAVAGEEGGVARLYVRRLDELTLRPLPGTEEGRQPFFSPDGRWLGFFADRRLKKAPVGGGPVVTLAEVGGNPRGAAWTQGGVIVFAPSQTSGLQRVPETGGIPTPLTSLEAVRGDSSHRWPAVLPGQPWILYTAVGEDASYDEARLEAVSLETGERRLLLKNGAYGRYVPDGKLAFVRASRLLGVSLKLPDLATRGEPEVLVDGVRYDSRNGAAHVAVSASGTVIYAPAPPSVPERYVSWLDRKGHLSRLVDAPRLFGQPRLSRDGRHVALRIGGADASELWRLDTTSGTLSRILPGVSVYRPIWRPDGRSVTMAAERDGRWRLVTLSAEGDAPPSVLVEGNERMYPDDWSPDGRHLVYQARSAQGGWDLRMLDVDADGRPRQADRPLVATPFHETSGVVSRDGTRLAFESDEIDGIVQVYVRTFPGSGDRIRVSSGGARAPRWGPDGRLYYWATNLQALESVRVELRNGRLASSGSQPVHDAEAAAAMAGRLAMSGVDGYDIDSAGRFLVLEAVADTGTQPLSRPVVLVRPVGR
jgi:Tol biopolymer transport system component